MMMHKKRSDGWYGKYLHLLRDILKVSNTNIIMSPSESPAY